MKRQIMLATVLCFCMAAAADQNHPHLNELFHKLKQTKETTAGESLTQEIWGLWYEVENTGTKELFDRAVMLMSAGQMQQSLVLLTEVVKSEPGFAEGWNRRATLFYLIGEFTLSVKDIEQTLELEPRHFGAISGLGQIYLRQNRLLEAKSAFARALEINPHLIGAQISIERINDILSERSI